uniref:Replication protein A 70 kDa DNA-binding subunit B/D first OB fold domain-containing protein n=1 Tax=Oryza rufipogon TaxID=4529 RepID=A0A0E0R5K1_ORYRU
MVYLARDCICVTRPHFLSSLKCISIYTRMGASAVCTTLISSASTDGVNKRGDVGPVLDLGYGPKFGRNSAEITPKENSTVALHQDRHALCDQTRFKQFDNVQFEDCVVNRAFSVIVMVDAKFHSEAHGETQRFILMDATGSKMEAVVSGELATRFQNILIVGQKYTIHGVYFQPNYWKLNFRAIKRQYECFFTRNTIVESYNQPLHFPIYPKQLTEFSELSAYYNKMFVGPIQRVSNRLYREVTLMDMRCQLVVIGVYANHLTTHVLQWASAFANNHVVVGTMLQLDRTYYFRRFVVNGEVNLSFVDRYHVTRWVHIAEVLDSKSSFKKNIKHA